MTLDPELFLPDPPQVDVRYTVISVDDHVVEPPHLFEEYMSPRLRELGPKVVEHPNGAEVWEFDGETFYQVGMMAFAGRRKETMKEEPSRFEHMRPGCYDADARVADMDVAGIWAMLNFPSQISGGSAGGSSQRPKTEKSASTVFGPGTTGCSPSGSSPIQPGSSRAPYLSR
jgi:hypothetical protein